ncbi:MAG: hypothetical protein AABX30_03145 [Nanoarchaeota archaeon]
MQKRKLELAPILIIFILLVNLAFVSAIITGRIGNAEMVLYPDFDGSKFESIEKTILVKNVNNISLNISLKTDTAGEEFIDIIDNEFRLAPGENRTARFKVQVKKTGTYTGRINVFFTPDEGNGIALPSKITVIAKEDSLENSNNNSADNSDLDLNDSDKGGITGNSIFSPLSNLSKTLIFLILTTIILIIILIYLFSLMSKKSKKTEDKSTESAEELIQEIKKDKEEKTENKPDTNEAITAHITQTQGISPIAVKKPSSPYKRHTKTTKKISAKAKENPGIKSIEEKEKNE